MDSKTPRRLTRHAVRLSGELASPGRRFSIEVADMHVEGVGLRSPKPVAQGEEMELALSLPGDRHLLIAGVQRWSRPNDSGMWNVGLQLKHTQSSREALLEFLWRLRMGEEPTIERK